MISGSELKDRTVTKLKNLFNEAVDALTPEDNSDLGITDKLLKKHEKLGKFINSQKTEACKIFTENLIPFAKEDQKDTFKNWDEYIVALEGNVLAVNLQIQGLNDDKEFKCLLQIQEHIEEVKEYYEAQPSEIVPAINKLTRARQDNMGALLLEVCQKGEYDATDLKGGSFKCTVS